MRPKYVFGAITKKGLGTAISPDVNLSDDTA